MQRLFKPLLWAFLLTDTGLLLLHMVVIKNVGSGRLTSPEGLMTCALLVVVPALIFLPIASRLATPFYDIEAILGWSTLGFVVIFFAPSNELTYGQFLALLLPLTVSIASVTTLVAYAFVHRLQPIQPAATNLLQARRIGYLAALALVALTLLNALALLTPFNGALVVAVVVLAELLALASRRPPLVPG